MAWQRPRALRWKREKAAAKKRTSPWPVRRRAAAAAAIGVAGVLLLGVGALVGLAASGVIDASFLGEAVGLIG